MRTNALFRFGRVRKYTNSVWATMFHVQMKCSLSMFRKETPKRHTEPGLLRAAECVHGHGPTHARMRLWK
jgi:hypothetical protein